MYKNAQQCIKKEHKMFLLINQISMLWCEWRESNSRPKFGKLVY